MNICKKLAILAVSLVLISTLLNNSCQSVEAEESSKTSDDGDNDYFYDSNMSESEIKKQKEEKAAQERAREEEEKAKKTTEAPPEWFAPSNDTDDPMAKFMESAIKDYMKKMQKEYMEKMKNKKKSDIDHPFWSVVTLSVFFGTGILIGISIVVIRGSKFNKNSRMSSSANGKKSRASASNATRDSIRKTDYVSVPTNEKITI